MGKLSSVSKAGIKAVSEFVEEAPNLSKTTDLSPGSLPMDRLAQDEDFFDTMDLLVGPSDLKQTNPVGEPIEQQKAYVDATKDVLEDNVLPGTLSKSPWASEVANIPRMEKHISDVDRIVADEVAYVPSDTAGTPHPIYDMFKEAHLFGGYRVGKRAELEEGANAATFSRIISRITPYKTASPNNNTTKVIDNLHTLDLLRYISKEHVDVQAKLAVYDNRRFHPDVVLSPQARKNFWEWLGEDSYRDAEGNPIVVFRTGSPLGESGFPRAFTGEREFSAHYGTRTAALTEDTGGEPRSLYFGSDDADKTIEVAYLNIKNPLMVRDRGNFGNDSLIRRIGEVGLSDKVPKELELRAMNPTSQEAAEITRELKRILMDEGYDSIAYINGGEGYGSISYIPFAPNQIKSIRNSGEFNPEVRNTLNSLVGPALVGAGTAGVMTEDKPDGDLVK